MDAPVSFGRMPMLAASVVNGGPEILMTGLFGRAHFQIGWFEDVDAVLDLEAARAHGVDVFRRPIWGGGTAFYDTNASALLAFFIRDDRFSTLDEALATLRPAMERALADLGLGECAFEGSSDIRWRGRKLGTVISQGILGTKVVGGFLNLRKPDLALYEKIAHVPEEKFRDKVIKDMVEYVCTPAEVRGTDLTYEEFHDAVARAASSVIELHPSAFTEEEEVGTKNFVEGVSGEEHVRRISSARFRSSAPTGCRVGFANVKAKKLVRAGVALDVRGLVARAMLAGDMHLSPPDVLDRAADALVGARAADAVDVRARIQAVLSGDDVTQPDETAGITADDCAQAVVRAGRDAG